MKEFEMEEVARRLNKIKAKREELKSAEHDFALLKKAVAEGWVETDWSWKPTLPLTKGDRYGMGRREVSVRIPVNVVHQQLGDRVRKIKRELAGLGAAAE